MLAIIGVSVLHLNMNSLRHCSQLHRAFPTEFLGLYRTVNFFGDVNTVKILKVVINQRIWLQSRSLTSCCRGALNRVPAGATAFPHRNKLALIQFYVSWQNPANAEASLKWIDAAYKAVSSYVGATAAYENYIDEDLGAAGPTDYFGQNLPRLQRIKAQWDKHSFFSYPGSISPRKWELKILIVLRIDLEFPSDADAIVEMEPTRFVIQIKY